MKINNIKSLLAVVAIVVVSATMSSCNRGYGCPNNFSISEQAVDAAQTVVTNVAKSLIK